MNPSIPSIPSKKSMKSMKSMKSIPSKKAPRLFMICPQCLERYESSTLKRCIADRELLVVTTTPEGIALVAKRKARGMSGGTTRTRAIRKPTPHHTATTTPQLRGDYDLQSRRAVSQPSTLN